MRSANRDHERAVGDGAVGRVADDEDALGAALGVPRHRRARDRVGQQGGDVHRAAGRGEAGEVDAVHARVGAHDARALAGRVERVALRHGDRRATAVGAPGRVAVAAGRAGARARARPGQLEAAVALGAAAPKQLTPAIRLAPRGSRPSSAHTIGAPSPNALSCAVPPVSAWPVSWTVYWPAPPCSTIFACPDELAWDAGSRRYPPALGWSAHRYVQPVTALVAAPGAATAPRATAASARDRRPRDVVEAPRIIATTSVAVNRLDRTAPAGGQKDRSSFSCRSRSSRR